MELTVELGDRSYPILIEAGTLNESLAEKIRKTCRATKLYVITDENVASHYAVHFTGVDTIVLPAGETTKSFAHYQSLCEQLLQKGVDRQTILIALGGGVIGDLVGFTAATLLRGLSFVQVPTTLLAQVDSSVGGKTGINTPDGKNLVGAFHQPKWVIIDPETLKTLPNCHLRAGYAEALKYALIQDATFFEWMKKNGAAVLAGDIKKQQHVIATSCEAKATIVAEDEKESGKRALLNLGHTFGHAIEKLNNYDESILHGEAVALGMSLAFRLSEKMGLCPEQDVRTVESHLASAGLPTRLANFKTLPAAPEFYLAAMKADKKTLNDELVFVLTNGIGSAFIANDVPANLVAEVLKESLAAR